MKIYNLTDYSIHETTQSIWDGWVASGNSKAQRYAPLPEPPEFDPATHTCEWGQGEWVVSKIPPPVRRVWETAGDFWGEFTAEEQLAISSSSVPEVQALVVSLSVWPAKMWSDDDRVQSGFRALKASGLISQSRANQILNPPGLKPV